MLTKEMENALNDQLNAESYSAYLYLSMSAYFRTKNLDGFANWMYAQAQEEVFHASKFYDFIIQRGGRILLQKIEAPPTDWESPLTVFQDTLEHEQKVTGLIHNLVDLAQQTKDHASNIFLQWFVTEQVEEEENAGSVLEKLKLLEDTSGGLFILDQELSKRTFNKESSDQ